jgi:GT2 family glycosyltransferase
MALLLRRSAVRQVGGFDSSIFLYGEDIDLGQRLREAGWTLWLLPEARATHLIAASQGGVSTQWIDALHRLYAQRAPRAQLFVYDSVLALGLALRALSAGLRRSEKRDLHARRMRASARRATDLLITTAAHSAPAPEPAPPGPSAGTPAPHPDPGESQD